MAAAQRRRRSTRPAPSRELPPPPPPGDGWWGTGDAPWVRWPNVTIETPSVWVPEQRRWESPDGRFFFDQEAADVAAEFFPTFLTHHKGEFAGVPFDLLPYQELLVIRPLFGWKWTDSGLRRFRKLFLAVPKGNGKSPLVAGIGLKLVFADGEDGAEVYSAAADRDQAAIVFDTARIMVEANEDLSELAKVMRRVIEIPSTHSYYRVLSADARTKHGPNIHGLVIDEFHAQPNRDLYEVLHRGTLKRRQPITGLVTTAGDDDESICAEEWDYARKVQSGSFDDETYLPVIFEASKDDNWKDPEVWKRVNPGFGITVKAEGIANECKAAQLEPRKLNDFLRYHLNRWVNQAANWIPIDWWDACKGELDDNALRELPVFGGLDMSQKYDLTNFTLVFPSPLPGPAIPIEVVGTENEEAIKKTVSLNFRISVVPFFWLPADTLNERVKQDRVPYDQWERDGLLRVTEGNVIDYDTIVRDITGEITERFPRLKGAQIGYDPAFATDIALKLQGAGYQMVEVLQNYKHLSEPSHVLEALIKAKRVSHDGHRLLRWNFENVAVRTDDAQRIRPVKPKKAAKRIDGVVGTLMGLSRAMLEPVPQKSIYETEGIFYV